VADELERRLRDSLRAYADLVDEPESTDLPAAPTPPRPVVGRWRGVVLVAAAAAAVVTGSVWLVTGDDADTTASSAAGSARSGTEATSGQPEGDTLAADAGAAEAQPLASSPEVGVPYAVELYTHCGVFGIELGSIWFAADPPLVEGAGNPPPGWGNPYQPGTVTLLTADEALFGDAVGHEVRLSADDTARPGPCD